MSVVGGGGADERNSEIGQQNRRRDSAERRTERGHVLIDDAC